MRRNTRSTERSKPLDEQQKPRKKRRERGDDGIYWVN
jgi:hypothetical protein